MWCLLWSSLECNRLIFDITQCQCLSKFYSPRKVTHLQGSANYENIFLKQYKIQWIWSIDKCDKFIKWILIQFY